jgi:hypothetical protein
MKPTREWDVAYVLGLPGGEQDRLERKGTRALDINLDAVDPNRVRTELSVNVSAMANTGGGQIVYGLSDQGAIDAGGISKNIRGGTKEWLEDIIPHAVEYSLKGFAVYELPEVAGFTHCDPGKAVFVIDVPDSDEAPHQALDGKYYGRVGGKSRPLPHRLVMDIVNRRKYPVIEPTFAWSRDKGRSTSDRHRYQLQITLTNHGPIRALNYLLQVKIPKAVPAEDPHIHGVTSEEQEGIRYVVFEYADRPGFILFPGHTVDVLTGLGYSLDRDVYNRIRSDDLELRWKTFADDMPPRHGSVRFAELQEW